MTAGMYKEEITQDKVNKIRRMKAMEIKTFDISYLQETKTALKSAFFHENSNEVFNEWEFAEPY